MSGPGLDEPIAIAGDDAGGYPTMSGLIPGPAKNGTRESELGPRYTVRYVVRNFPGQPPVVQQLYPFAEGGP